MSKSFLFLIVLLVLAAAAGSFLIYSHYSQEEIVVEKEKEEELSKRDKFINSAVLFLEKAALSFFEKEEIGYSEILDVSGDWNVSVVLYHQGDMMGRGVSIKEFLPEALKEAVNNAMAYAVSEGIEKDDLKDITFSVSLSDREGEVFSFAGKEGRGEEMIGNMVSVYKIDKDLIYEKLKEGKDFLFRMEDKEKNGFYKRYEAVEDYFPERLHTVYSASIIYTFLFMNDLEEDKEIMDSLSRWADFLLSMQNEELGAFHYSYFLDKEEKEMRFVSGTSALSIFTLLRLYEVTGNPDYLDSAKRAGDWLITMQREDGSMKPYLEYEEEEWSSGSKESLLYNGQCLSALSKLYNETKEEKYYNAALGVAKRFTERYEKSQGFIVGEYREENPISNAWAVMSLMDFYKTKREDYYKEIVFDLADLLLKEQNRDEKDIKNYGRWEGAYSTSGMGWLSEVTGEVYRLCLEENGRECEKYKKAVVSGIRWIVQRTYSDKNSFKLKNPERAEGGVFWNEGHSYIRTDSVCHGGNSYARIMPYLEEGTLISLPEPSLEDILALFRP